MLSASCVELHDILYIDDDSDILMLARIALEKLGGFHVDICADASEAIAMAEYIHPDLIMLDVMMPGIDGISLLRTIKENLQLCDTPVVFMTARMQPAEMDKYVALGAAGAIPKPFDPMTLSEEIRRIWRTSKHNACQTVKCNIDDLRYQYLKKLSDKRTKIESFGKNIRLKKVSAAEVRTIELLVHNLAGSGETYGYRAITKSAQIMEELLLHDPNSPKFSMVISSLLAAIDGALAQTH